MIPERSSAHDIRLVAPLGRRATDRLSACRAGSRHRPSEWRLRLGVGLPATSGAVTAPGVPAAQPVPAAPEMVTPPDRRTQPGPAGRARRGQRQRRPAAWNMKVVSNTPPSEKFVGAPNSDLAFTGKYIIQGNFNGYQVWDISDPRPDRRWPQAYPCPARRRATSRSTRTCCSCRVKPRPGGSTAACRACPSRSARIGCAASGSSTSPTWLTPGVSPSPDLPRLAHPYRRDRSRDPENVYVYVSGSAGVRSAEELPGCLDGPIDDPNTARFRIEVIKVPLAAPERAAIVSSPRIFNNLPAPPRHADPPGTGRAGRGTPPAPDAPGATATAPGVAPGARNSRAGIACTAARD